MHIIADQAIRSGHQDPFKDGQGGPIPTLIQARPIQLGPTIAVVAVDVFLGQMPLRLGHHVLAKPGQLLFNIEIPKSELYRLAQALCYSH
jgi:hypothetical protein